MNSILLWCLTGLSALMAVNAVFKLLSEHWRFKKENLTQEDTSFVWQVIFFIVFPFLTLLNLKATMVACQNLGGFVSNWAWGLIWYQATPQGLTSIKDLLTVLFAGPALEILLALCILPALLFRPHPFLAALVAYTSAFIIGLNLIVDPLMSLVGMGNSCWKLLYLSLPYPTNIYALAIHVALALGFIALVRSSIIATIFTGLIKPQTQEALKEAQDQYDNNPDDMESAVRLGLLLQSAGLNGRVRALTKDLNKRYNNSLYVEFLQAMLHYNYRNYALAQKLFMQCADNGTSQETLRAIFFAAAACCASADGDTQKTLYLCERALEFDECCLTARVLKIDYFLTKGKKDQVDEEIEQADRRGINLEDTVAIPLDVEYTLGEITYALAKSQAKQLNRALKL